MDISIFLAKILGTYFLIMCISMLLNARLVKDIFEDINNNPPLFFLTGAMTLLAGIVLVVSHNIWVNDWRIVITVVAWLTLLKGMVRVAFPTFSYKTMLSFLYNSTAYFVFSTMTLILGAFLSYAGFSS